VHLSALYIGTDELSAQIVDALRVALEEKPQLEVHILIDCLRATRKDRGTENSSITVLQPLLDVCRASQRARVSLFHSPELSGLLKWVLPPRWNETVSLMHMKALVFDEDLIMTGANLSHDYFLNRQDRYLLFEGCAGLASHFSSLINTVGDLSYQLREEGVLTHPTPDPVQDPTQFRASLREALQAVCHAPQGDLDPNSHTTVAYTTVQFGPANVRHDEEATAAVLAAAGPGSALAVTTGYFNCTPRYEAHLLASSGSEEGEVWVAAPSANGFYGAKGAASLIARAYSLFAEHFHERITAAGQAKRVSLREYARVGWTYHAKGLWHSLKPGQDPVLTMIGSPNFGERSVHRDLEASVILVTGDTGLRGRLAGERAAIREHTEAVSEATFQAEGRFGDQGFDAGSERRGVFIRVVTRLCKGFL